MKTEVPEQVTNGTKSSEAEAEAVVEKKDKEDRADGMQVDSKEQNSGRESVKTDTDEEIKEKMEEDKGPSEEKEAKMELDKEEPKPEAMEEKKSLYEQQKKRGKLGDKNKGSKEKTDDKKENEGEEAPEENAGENQEAEQKEGEKEEAMKHKGDEKLVKESQKEKDEEEKSTVEKESKKHTRGKSDGRQSMNKKKKVAEKEQEPRTPASDRPVRERKSVERLVSIIERDTSREFYVEKGSGTPLKDIPNVAYKLSRRKSDDTFKLLHTILYGRRGKAAEIKHNILRFSGFVWRENEEKQRMKVKEKFDKCVKEKLLEFCDVLDIPIAKATTKKEDIVGKLLDFLMAPHATTTVLLAEKDQGKKRKRAVMTGAFKSPSKRSSKSQSMQETDDESEAEEEKEEEKDEEKENEKEEKENGVGELSEDEKSDQSGSMEKKEESEDEYEQDTGKEKRQSGKRNQETQKKIQTTESSGKATSKKNTRTKKSSSLSKATPKKSSSRHSKVDKGSDTTPKVFSRKKKDEEPEKEKLSASKIPTPMAKSGKKAVEGKKKSRSKEEKLKPSDDELRTAICDILKEVDFNTATFTDILKQLAKQFNTDLAPRKSLIKLMIQDELTKLAEEADGEEEGDDGNAKKDDAQAAAKDVEA